MTEATQDKGQQEPVEPPEGPDSNSKPPAATPLPGEKGYSGPMNQD